MSQSSESQRVVVLGASNKPDRYSYKALRMLREHGHEVIPVHPMITEVEDLAVVPDLTQVEGAVDTLTMYVYAQVGEGMVDQILALNPGRVIFNPGTESPMLQTRLDAAEIPFEEACTLVLLQTGQF